ncbi:MAG: hypothetical protein QN144_13945 [Armatimonadota bacterium]|nr:hypothetical protein [Armatimonadota bacterium]
MPQRLRYCGRGPRHGRPAVQQVPQLHRLARVQKHLYRDLRGSPEGLLDLVPAGPFQSRPLQPLAQPLHGTYLLWRQSRVVAGGAHVPLLLHYLEGEPIHSQLGRGPGYPAHEGQPLTLRHPTPPRARAVVGGQGLKGVQHHASEYVLVEPAVAVGGGQSAGPRLFQDRLDRGGHKTGPAYEVGQGGSRDPRRLQRQEYRSLGISGLQCLQARHHGRVAPAVAGRVDLQDLAAAPRQERRKAADHKGIPERGGHGAFEAELGEGGLPRFQGLPFQQVRPAHDLGGPEVQPYPLPVPEHRCLGEELEAHVQGGRRLEGAGADQDVSPDHLVLGHAQQIDGRSLAGTHL